jgi:hypothetical protein
MCGIDSALDAAEDEGKRPELCLSNGSFIIALGKCDLCLAAYATGSEPVGVAALSSSLGEFLTYCGDNNLNVASFYSLLSVENSLANVQASLCSVNNIISDCLTTESNNTTLSAALPASTATQRTSSSLYLANSSTSTIRSYQSTTQSPPLSGGTIVSVSTIRSFQSTTQSPPLSGGANAGISAIRSFQSTTQSPPLSGGAIAGVAVGCTLAFVVIVGFLIFFFLRRHKQRRQRVIEQAEAANIQGAEKAQLHSEDLKPNRNELAGDQHLVLKRHVPVIEMPANEIAGSELEGEK